jgi:K+-sensing histidine kinase KdpD
MSAGKSTDHSPNVPWPDVVKFIRQLGHDIRNNLNAVELQSAYLAELAPDGELKDEVKRLREMVSTIGTSLQKLGGALGQSSPNPISYSAADFVDDIKQKLAKNFPNESAKVNWEVKLKDEKLQIDPLIGQQAFLELFDNAFRHERDFKQITAKACSNAGNFVFELDETKSKFEVPTDNWGREPLRYMGQGHYGLGLNRVRIVIEAHGGNFGAEFNRSTSTLTTKITLPLST